MYARDPQPHRTGPRLPVPVAIPITLDSTLGTLLTAGRPGQAAHFQFRQTLNRKADPPEQQIRIGALLHETAQGRHLVVHGGSLGCGVGPHNPTLPGNRR